MSSRNDLFDQVRQLRLQGKSPKQVAKALGLPLATVNPLIRQVAGRRPVSAPDRLAPAATDPADRAVVGCWISSGWSLGLGLDDAPPEWSADEPSEGDDSIGGGLALVTVAREEQPGRATVCGFLVDVYCLGVKNVVGPIDRRADAVFDVRGQLYTGLDQLPRPIPIELAQHVVHGAVAYAGALGFEPHPEFAEAAPYLGEPSGPTPIRFGRYGQPFYVSGPDDDAPAVLRTLRASVGEGNYHFIAPMTVLPD